jgi:hypothetical protein
MIEIACEKHASDGDPPVSPLGVTSSAATALSFVVGVTDIAILQNNFIASPCVADAGSPHEVILVRGGPNVTAKLSHGLEQAVHDWIVCIHQDVWLPPLWDLQVAQQIREAERLFGPVGVAGVYGVGDVAAADEFALAMGSGGSSIADGCSRTVRSCQRELPRLTSCSLSCAAIRHSNLTRRWVTISTVSTSVFRRMNRAWQRWR